MKKSTAYLDKLTRIPRATDVVNDSRVKDAGIFFWRTQCINMLLGPLVILRIVLL